MDSDINVFENRVEVYVVDRIRFNAAVQSGKVQLPDNVKIITVNQLAKRNVDIYGGLTLSPDCTSGFSVVNAGGTRGIATAGHCPNSMSYNGTNLPYQGELFRDSFDVQWHTAPGFTVRNKIRWSSDGLTRDITSKLERDQQMLNTYVCKYGRTTFYTCGNISSKDYCPTYVPSCDATFIRVNNNAGYSNLSSGGDSGGPWFILNTAYGIHSGEPGPDPGDALYMAQNYVGGLGVTVIINP